MSATGKDHYEMRIRMVRIKRKYNAAKRRGDQKAMKKLSSQLRSVRVLLGGTK